jgi:hypothetical protein
MFDFNFNQFGQFGNHLKESLGEELLMTLPGYGQSPEQHEQFKMQQKEALKNGQKIVPNMDKLWNLEGYDKRGMYANKGNNGPRNANFDPYNPFGAGNNMVGGMGGGMGNGMGGMGGMGNGRYNTTPANCNGGWGRTG